MFSVEEKQKIAKEIESLLLSFDHPEMPHSRPYFEIHIDGKETWSWADIKPNWKVADKGPAISSWHDGQIRRT